MGRRRNAAAGAIPRARAHALASMAGFACLLLSSSAWGHVAFSTPDADTEVLIGTSVELTWRDTISHNTLAYHLDFYRDPLGEPLRVASDLPPTQHSYEWIVDGPPCEGCYFVVTQDNSGADYYGSLDLIVVNELSVGGFAGSSGVGGSGDTGGGDAGGNSSVGGALSSGGAAPAGGTGPAGGSGGTLMTSAGGTGTVTASGGMGGPSTAGEGSLGCAFSAPPSERFGSPGALLLLGLLYSRRRRWAERHASPVTIPR